jgi:hypothetical protein
LESGQSGGEKPEPNKPSDTPSPESPTGTGQPDDYERTVEGVTPVGMGATEGEGMIHEGDEPPTSVTDSPVENVSDDSPEVNTVQTDSTEGQAFTDDEDDMDETKQST